MRLATLKNNASTAVMNKAMRMLLPTGAVCLNVAKLTNKKAPKKRIQNQPPVTWPVAVAMSIKLLVLEKFVRLYILGYPATHTHESCSSS